MPDTDLKINIAVEVQLAALQQLEQSLQRQIVQARALGNDFSKEATELSKVQAALNGLPQAPVEKLTGNTRGASGEVQHLSTAVRVLESAMERGFSPVHVLHLIRVLGGATGAAGALGTALSTNGGMAIALIGLTAINAAIKGNKDSIDEAKKSAEEFAKTLAELKKERQNYEEMRYRGDIPTRIDRWEKLDTVGGQIKKSSEERDRLDREINAKESERPSLSTDENRTRLEELKQLRARLTEVDRELLLAKEREKELRALRVREDYDVLKSQIDLKQAAINEQMKDEESAYNERKSLRKVQFEEALKDGKETVEITRSQLDDDVNLRAVRIAKLRALSEVLQGGAQEVAAGGWKALSAELWKQYHETNTEIRSLESQQKVIPSDAKAESIKTDREAEKKRKDEEQQRVLADDQKRLSTSLANVEARAKNSTDITEREQLRVIAGILKLAISQNADAAPGIFGGVASDINQDRRQGRTGFSDTASAVGHGAGDTTVTVPRPRVQDISVEEVMSRAGALADSNLSETIQSVAGAMSARDQALVARILAIVRNMQ